MVERVLDEFKMPVNGNTEVILRVVQGERLNTLLIIMDDKVIPINLIGYGANALFEVGNKFAIKYASLTELMPNFPPFTPQAQPFRGQQGYTPRPTFTKSSSPIQPSKEITVDEAIAILKKKSPVPKERVLVKTTPADMIDFIIKFKGGSELYVKGDLTIVKEANLFLDYKLFKDTLVTLVRDRVISELHKISRTDHPYTVYVIPKELPVSNSDSGTRPVPATTNIEKNNTDSSPAKSELPTTTLPIRQGQVSPEGVSLVRADQVKSSITNYLETLFYSFQDSELNMELFLSEAQYQKIPLEVARDFYIKKLEERDKRLLRLNKGSMNNKPTWKKID